MPVMIIAEAGVNHNGSIQIAEKLIDTAKEAGADAVKFQTFKTAKLVTTAAEKAKYQTVNTGIAESQYNMLSRLELSREMHLHLKNYCDKVKITFLSTPFDFESVDLLTELNVPIYKISSGDLTNIPLLRYVSAIGRPVILSSGMSTLGEIKEALETVYSKGNRKVTVLHCTTNYPTPFEEANLNAMNTIQNAFKVDVGYSDHTDGIEAAIAAVAMGAVVIEKHFTMDRNLPGPDHKASLEPADLKKLVRSIRNIEKALGSGIKSITASEAAIMNTVRKSIVARNMIKKGQSISMDDLEIKRPMKGIEPKYLDDIIGKTARRDINPEEHIQWLDLE